MLATIEKKQSRRRRDSGTFIKRWTSIAQAQTKTVKRIKGEKEETEEEGVVLEISLLQQQSHPTNIFEGRGGPLHMRWPVTGRGKAEGGKFHPI
mmetsp:Transcript_10677/g.22607  ORF Transcript_10677/g.22607 Transcript_10677/m.22607 type:complete len:94 (-) Transcript_10677:555-836(-)